MNKLSIICIIIAQLVMIVSILIVMLQRRSMKTMIERLTLMIDEATKGTLKSRKPDGSIYSELEVKMNQYLKLCIVRNRRTKEKKDLIKSLIAEVAFQTQAPLANVKMYSNMLLEQPDLSEDNKKIATRISRQSERLNVMLESLVKISLLESGLNSITPKMQNVGGLLSEVKQELEPLAEKKNITIQYKRKGNIQAVIDYPWTMVAVSNILENAIKYSHPDSIVKMSIIHYEMYTRIDITDNGIGIDYKETEAVFKCFYRGKEAQKQPGLGIGLYLAKHIIQEQCGYIKVSSIVGKGTMFSIFLPSV